MTPTHALPAVLQKIDADLDQSLERLFEFLRIQSISTDPAYKDQCQSAAEYVAKDLSGIGFKTSIRPTEGHPIVVGKGSPRANGKAPRVLFYGHYDVQPVDPLALWETPPFAPRIATLPDGRKIIVARGACDDKGQVMTFIEACRAFTAVTGELPLPITMMIEGEEECGSNHLFGFVKDNADEFKLDLALICDTSMWDPQTPMVTTSLRGLVYEEVRLTCADRDLHSGLFGGGAPWALPLIPIKAILLNALSVGLLLFMLAAGLSLILGLMGVLNMAHAGFYLLGAYAGHALTAPLGYAGALLVAALIPPPSPTAICGRHAPESP